MAELDGHVRIHELLRHLVGDRPHWSHIGDTYIAHAYIVEDHVALAVMVESNPTLGLLDGQILIERLDGKLQRLRTRCRLILPGWSFAMTRRC